MPVLVVGTRNPKKREEILEILADLPIEVRDLTGWPDAPEVVEDGDTFEANARKKASELARHLNHWVLGEDSGLVVPALNGRPGVYSARYAGKQGDDAANNRRLLAELAPAARRPAGGLLRLHRGAGRPGGRGPRRRRGPLSRHSSSRNYRGGGGFGYDPLFLIPEYHQTFGELSARAKHAISHRARALARLRPALRRFHAYPPSCAPDWLSHVLTPQPLRYPHHPHRRFLRHRPGSGPAPGRPECSGRPGQPQRATPGRPGRYHPHPGRPGHCRADRRG